jgi:hypothetical protein
MHGDGMGRDGGKKRCPRQQDGAPEMACMRIEVTIDPSNP